MAAFERIIWIVLDSVGIGELPDAAEYGDVGRNTLGHIARSRALALPNLMRLGLANIAPLDHLPPSAAPQGCYGKGATHSPGKDTTTGHWEMAGIWLPQAFPVYKHGLPARVDRAVRTSHRPQDHRQQARLRHGNHQGTGRGARPNGFSDRVHLGRQRIPDCGARGRDSHRRAVPHVRDRAQNARRAEQGWARDRPALHRDARKFPAHRTPPRLRGRAAAIRC